MKLHQLMRRWTWSSRHTLARARALLRRQGLGGLFQAFWQRIRLRRSQHSASARRTEESLDPAAEAARFQAEMAGFASRPFFSLYFVPGQASAPAIQATLVSIAQQVYPDFELIRLEASDLSGWAEKLQAGRARFCTLVYPGMLLAPDLLFETAKALQAHPGAALLYPDHAVVDQDPARSTPVLKPDWSPDFLLSGDYIGTLRFFSTAFAQQAASPLSLQDPALNYELSLRALEQGAQVVHMPKVLLSLLSPAQPALDPRQSLMASFARQGISARLEPLPGRADLAIPHFALPEDTLVSIIICTHDQPALLSACLDSIFGLTRGVNFEVVLVDHASRQDATRELIAAWVKKEPRRFLVKRIEGPFNFSSLNNAGVRSSRGQTVVLLNNDVEVLTPTWLQEMAGWAQRPGTGAVGACLLYPNRTIQHAGILLGMRDLAVHAWNGKPADHPGYMQRLRVPSNFLALTGACLMLRRALYEDLGGLDERFAVAGGDIDLCLRAHARGCTNVLLPHVRLLHYESATRGFEDSPAKQARLRQEYDLLKQRWPAIQRPDPYYHPDLNRLRGDFTP